jgi:hypothetical protein
MSKLGTQIAQELASMWTISKQGYIMPENNIHMALIWGILTKDKEYPGPTRMAAFYCACRLQILSLDETWVLDDLFDEGTGDFYDAILDVAVETPPTDFIALIKEYRDNLSRWFTGNRSIETVYGEQL